jgi:hypothetical protein
MGIIAKEVVDAYRTAPNGMATIKDKMPQVKRARRA